jgi:hypothetical protein
MPWRAIIELQSNSYADALYNSHLDDNNRLNHEGGWVVRSFRNLTNDGESYMVLREDVTGDESRYRLITSYESGPELEKWIFENDPVTEVDVPELDQGFAAGQEAQAQARREARTARYGYDPTTVMSEA